MLLKIFRLRSPQAVRWAVAIACFLASLFLLGWLTPAILGSRLVWPRVLASLTSDLDAQVSSSGVSLGWFSPVVIRGVHIADRQGQQLAQIGQVSTESTLLSLLFHPQEPGVVVVDKPALTIVWRDDGSNLEDVLSAWLAKSSSGEVTRGSIEVHGGSVDVVDVSRSHLVQLASINAKIQLPNAAGSQGVITVDKSQLQIGSQAGDCAMHVQWQGEAKERTWKVSTQVHDVGLSFIETLSRRFGADLRIEGVLTADVACTWNGTQGEVDVRHAHAQALNIVAPAWLGKDQLRLERMRIAGSCAVTDRQWEFRQAQLECDAGQVTIDGQCARQSDRGSSIWQQLLRSAAAADLQLDGRVDLACLASTLPHTMHIREGVTIETGAVEIRLKGQQAADARRWTARLKTWELAAVREGRRFTWSDPLQVSLEASQNDQGWQVQQLNCNSSFLQLLGQAAPQEGSFELTCDLHRLVSELQPLFDLGDLQATGTVAAQLRWERNDQGRITLEGTGGVDRLEWTRERGSTCRETRVETTLLLEADTDGQKLTSVRGGRFELVSGEDRVELQLLEPVAAPVVESPWAVGVKLSGQLASWLSRARPFLSAPLLEGEGPLRLECAARISPQAWEVQQLVLHVEPCRFRRGNLQVDERVVHVELEGSWARNLGQVSIAEGLFQSSALAFRVTDGGVNLAHARPAMTGEISFRTDLERLHSAWQMAYGDPKWRVTGAAEGQVSLVQHETSTAARWSLGVTGAELGRRTQTTLPSMSNVIPTSTGNAWSTVWKEPSLKFIGSGQYDAMHETVQLDRCDLTSADQFALSAQGRIARPFSECEVDLQGRATYDLAKLLERIGPGTRLRISGRDTQEFWLRGPLFHPPDAQVQQDVEAVALVRAGRGILPPELSGLAGLRWQSADLLGIPVGPGLLNAKLAAGTIETGALEIPLSQGMLRMTPHLYLNKQPPLLTVDPGQVLTDVNITPGMCQGWLKYVTPLVADATRAEGKFSLQLERAAVLLQQPADAQLQGVILVDSARVGPGPLAREIMSLGEQIKALLERRLPAPTTQELATWVTIPRQNTRFQLANGRLAHGQFDVLIGDTPVRTQGSVGLDQTLALMAEVKIQDEWIGGDPRLAWLKGNTVSIPIGGTLSRPQLDARALEKLSSQVLQQTANRLLQEGVHRGLQQFWGPQR
ncbi:MAG: hypothetical protein ACYC6N_15995 [Pirellulaceae bacterium]